MLEFSTKANTLKSLQGKSKKFNILHQVSFTVQELENEPEKLREQILREFSGKKLIVRSSALSEDSAQESLAGKFLSVTNINPENIIDAARQVKASFSDTNPKNQILVQPMLDHIAMSGVLFTLDPNTGGNYFVINYDISGSADSVTSGEGKSLSACYIFHGKKCGDARLDYLCDAAQELMDLFEKKNIDIEFAFTSDDKLYLLQARPLVLKNSYYADFSDQKISLKNAYNYIAGNMCPRPYLKGKRTIYGVMPDWNPAEMIGIRPKPLASTLYRRLITDGTWAYQRDEYGYRNLRSFPLMVEFCGLPYIDIRVKMYAMEGVSNKELY